MKHCRKRVKVIDYFYDELTPDDRAQFEEHLEGCSECSGQLQQLNSTMKELSVLKPVRPTPRQLEKYHQHLKKYFQEESPIKKWLKDSYQVLFINPPLGVRFAKIAVVFIIGIIIGANFFVNRQGTPVYSENELKSQVLNNVIFESEFLLLEISNAEDARNLQEILENVNFMTLIQKTLFLKEHAKSVSDERLYDLLGQLELILLELANFDMTDPEQELDYIRKNIDELHIFVELRQMRQLKLL